jgi:hypothetical protein
MLCNTWMAASPRFRCTIRIIDWVLAAVTVAGIHLALSIVCVVFVLVFTALLVFASRFFTFLCFCGALYDWVIRAILIIAAVAACFFRRNCPSITQGNQSFLTFLALIWQGTTRDTCT